MPDIFNRGDDDVQRGLLRHKPTDTVYHVELEREDDGRWLAEITDLPGVIAYGKTQEEALRRALSLALRVWAERVDHGEALGSEGLSFSYVCS